MSRVCVIVRVHDRMEDLVECLRVMQRYWSIERHTLVVGNGRARGFAIPGEARALADEVLELEHNAGHILGNAQLLQAAVPRIPADCGTSVLIEADTWLYSDTLIRRYARRLEEEGAVWAAAGWQDRFHSVALDFAIVRSAALRDFPDLLQYHRSAECHVANRLRANGLRYLLIRELMPVHIPRLLRRFWNRYGGRFRCFPEGPLVSHHHEDLPQGFQQKLREANACLGREEYPSAGTGNWPAERLRLKRLRALAWWIPRSGHPGPKRERRIPPLPAENKP